MILIRAECHLLPPSGPEARLLGPLTNVGSFWSINNKVFGLTCLQGMEQILGFGGRVRAWGRSTPHFPADMVSSVFGLLTLVQCFGYVSSREDKINIRKIKSLHAVPQYQPTERGMWGP